MRRYKGTFDIFFGIEHRLRKEEMEEQFNREAKEGWRFAAHAARVTDESASDEEEEGAVMSIPGNEGRIAQAWVNVREICVSSRCSGTRMDGRRQMKPSWKRC